jgi:hypothetical protein
MWDEFGDALEKSLSEFWKLDFLFISKTPRGGIGFFCIIVIKPLTLLKVQAVPTI